MEEEKEHYCKICGRRMYAYENNYEGICQECLDENSILRDKVEKAENKDVVICEKCYEENEITRTTCKHCGAELYTGNIEIESQEEKSNIVKEEIKPKAELKKEVHELSIDDEEDRKIYNVSLIIWIVRAIGFGGSIVAFIILDSMRATGTKTVVLFLGIIATLIVTPIVRSMLKKENLETYFIKHKKFIKQKGMSNCQSASYNNIVGIDIDTNKKMLGVYSYYTNESCILNFSEVLDFEVFENGSSTISSRTGGAVIGGLLFGEVGAVVGASGSRAINEECTTLKLKIYTSDVKHSVVTLDFLDSSIAKTGVFSVIYEELNEVIKKMISFLKIAREDNRQAERKEDKKVIIENVEEVKTHSSNNVDLSSLKELAQLKEKGILTDEEFAEAKQKILAKL